MINTSPDGKVNVTVAMKVPSVLVSSPFFSCCGLWEAVSHPAGRTSTGNKYRYLIACSVSGSIVRLHDTRLDISLSTVPVICATGRESSLTVPPALPLICETTNNRVELLVKAKPVLLVLTGLCCKMSCML